MNNTDNIYFHDEKHANTFLTVVEIVIINGMELVEIVDTNANSMKTQIDLMMIYLLIAIYLKLKFLKY
jgi:hypothetical protein